ncbi:unnamed protein product [Protopolystoma xenopodis]|uniref:Ubiquitin conjugation factor E4 core domain-containing protein n=1 Tax=Protopolystoma xenopodis TaxID=117903 RepID=A0A3S5CKJ1_9PLAT|nr:unnamed protein product [Protopolystoma xenopodis]
MTDLCKQTRLAFHSASPTARTFGNSHVAAIVPSESSSKCAATSKNFASSSEGYPLLTEIFFLAQTALHIGWGGLYSLHMDTNRHLHQLETQWRAWQEERGLLVANSQSEPKGPKF